MGGVRLSFFHNKQLLKTNANFQVMRGFTSQGSREEERQEYFVSGIVTENTLDVSWQTIMNLIY